jgi:CubicO group peptidase (beta-lactamase class C family)
MKKLTFIIALVFAFQLVHTNVNAQLSSHQIDSISEKALKEFNVAGIAVAVVKDGKIVYEKGYGVRSVDTKLPVDEHTNFQIASNSKAFTTAALSILVDEKKISWKDKVIKYIPEFRMYNDYVTQNFLVEDLLCHRSGLGLGAGDLMDFPDGTDFTIHDVLTNFQYFKPQSDFRTKYDYDNQLYFVAGELIKRVSGMSWEQFVQSRIVDPLQMTNTFTDVRNMKDQTNLSAPHSTESGTLKSIKMLTLSDKMNGAPGGIVSNVDDMSKWVMMQLNNGKYGDKLEKQLFSPARQLDMWTIHTVIPVAPNARYNTHFAGYGLGWFLNDVKGNLKASHTGGLPGMLTSVTLIPDMKLGVIVFTNTIDGGGAAFSAISQSICDSYLGLPDNNWIDKYSKAMQSRENGADSVTIKVWQTVANNKNVAVDPAKYVGIYQDNWFGKIEVSLKGKQLWFRSLRSPKLNGPMQLYKDNTFAIKWEYQDQNCDAFAAFNLGTDGKAQSIKMAGISPNIDFSFDFQDLDLRRVK